mmetsp:Transcript_28430/g.80226  ORF Transcript_28430/g.80226 Transcript_28430/m.80226 type:complete len:603 (+) Transcript_28430:121-1929(+)
MLNKLEYSRACHCPGALVSVRRQAILVPGKAPISRKEWQGSASRGRAVYVSLPRPKSGGRLARKGEALPAEQRGSSLRAMAVGTAGSQTVEMDVKVAVITTAGCPHCKRAKAALKEAGIQYREVDLEGALDVLAKVKSISGKSTVPQVFVEGQLLGGADDVQEQLADGRLQKIVSAAQSTPLPKVLEELVASASQAQAGKPVASFLPPGFSRNEYTDLRQLADRMAAEGTGVSRTPMPTGGLFAPKEITAFTGADACAWILSNAEGVTTAEEAASLGNSLIAAKLISALGPKGGPSAPPLFQDSSRSFYQLSSDGMKPVLGKPLNEHITWDTEARSASRVAEDLRQLIVALYDKFLSADGTQVDYDGMSSDPLFSDYVNASAELQKVSLDQMSREESMAFFINIYNALIVHGTVVYGPPTSITARVRWFGQLRYNIGGLEFSGDDIEHGVLRGNKTSPSNVLVLLGLGKFASGYFKKEDPRAKYAISPMDPRIHFALVCGAKSCPPIRVYTPESLEAGLSAAASAFCEGSVKVDKAQNSVEMSMILKWYGKDFSNSLRGRLERIAEFLPEQPAADLKEILSTSSDDPAVTYPPYDWGVNKKN